MDGDELYHIYDGGKLLDTGKTVLIFTAYVEVYRCEVCGKEFDASESESMGTAAEVDAWKKIAYAYED